MVMEGSVKVTTYSCFESLVAFYKCHIGIYYISINLDDKSANPVLFCVYTRFNVLGIYTYGEYVRNLPRLLHSRPPTQVVN